MASGGACCHFPPKIYFRHYCCCVSFVTSIPYFEFNRSSDSSFSVFLSLNKDFLTHKTIHHLLCLLLLLFVLCSVSLPWFDGRNLGHGFGCSCLWLPAFELLLGIWIPCPTSAWSRRYPFYFISFVSFLVLSMWNLDLFWFSFFKFFLL